MTLASHASLILGSGNTAITLSAVHPCFNASVHIEKCMGNVGRGLFNWLHPHLLLGLSCLRDVFAQIAFIL